MMPLMRPDSYSYTRLDTSPNMTAVNGISIYTTSNYYKGKLLASRATIAQLNSSQCFIFNTTPSTYNNLFAHDVLKMERAAHRAYVGSLYNNYI